MRFLKPARGGEIIYFESKVVYTGRSSVFTYIRANVRSITGEDSQLVDGFITFVERNMERYEVRMCNHRFFTHCFDVYFYAGVFSQCRQVKLKAIKQE
jgi:acyl-CoA hydrolase